MLSFLIAIYVYAKLHLPVFNNGGVTKDLVACKLPHSDFPAIKDVCTENPP